MVGGAGTLRVPAGVGRGCMSVSSGRGIRGALAKGTSSRVWIIVAPKSGSSRGNPAAVVEVTPSSSTISIKQCQTSKGAKVLRLVGDILYCNRPLDRRAGGARGRALKRPQPACPSSVQTEPRRASPLLIHAPTRRPVDERPRPKEYLRYPSSSTVRRP